MSKNRSKRSRQQRKQQTPKLDLDIVIPVRNQFDYLKRCLDCLPEACGNLRYFTYLMDNDSNPEEAKPFYESLDVTKFAAFGFNQNIGFPMACNVGAKTGRSRYILFLNSDCFMTPGSIEKMYKDFSEIENLGIVGPKLVFPKLDTYDPHRPVGKIQHAGLSFNIAGKADHIFLAWDADHPKVNISCEVPAVTGACLMIERALFEQLGMFYEGYGIGTFEDVDLCMAAKAAGRVVWYDAQAVGEHVAGGTITREKTSFPLERNRYIFVGRWGNAVYWSDFDRY